jgi:hypothetical protein
MNEMRKLMEALDTLDESYFSELDIALDELVRNNPNLSADKLVAIARSKYGQEAATFLSDKLEAQADLDDFNNSDPQPHLREYEEERSYDDFVEYYVGDLSRSIVRKGVFKELYAAAGEDIDVLNAAIKDEAYSIADSYYGTGDGIGTSDMNHFIQHIGKQLGVDDVFGWYKKEEVEEEGELKSDDEMERDKVKRYAKYNKAIRGREGLGEENSDSAYDAYEDEDEFLGKFVKVTGGDHKGATGKVVNIDWYRDENGGKQMVYNVALDSGENIELYPSEWGHDQLEVVEDPFSEFMLDNPFESLEEAKGKGVNVPPEGFASSEEAEKFIHDLGPDDEVDDYVVDPETGEVLFEPFMTKRGVGMDQFKSARDRVEKMGTWVPSIYGANNQDDAWEELGDLRYGNSSAAKFYNIVWRNLGDLLGSPKDLGSDAEEWEELDYDTGYDVPVAIKRKDGKKMQEEDYDNFRELASLVKHATGNISLSMMGTTDKGTVARFTPTLM